MNDLRDTIIPKSDQLNSDDLIGGPRTIRITKVSRNAGEQPVNVHFDGDGGKPFRPCKSMRRVMVQAWGPNADAYAGRSMTLYRDEAVTFGGMAVGGIRISHLSDIPKKMTMALTATKGKRAPYVVEPLKAETATAGGPDKVAVALEHGADYGIDYKSEDIRERVKALTDGRGADVIYDPVGGAVFDASLRSIAVDGRILIIGFASGTVPQIPANILLVKNVTVIGYYWGAYRKIDPALVRASMLEALDWWAAGKLSPHVSKVMDLSEAVVAIEMLKTRAATGKIVLTTR